MLKPHSIDFERVDGCMLIGQSIEVQGSMTVRETTQPLEGVHQSSLSLSLDEAAKLVGYLTQALQAAQQQGWRPPPKRR